MRPGRLSCAFLAVSWLANSALGLDLQPSDAALAAEYSEARRGVSLLVMQNGRTVFEHYANGGASDRKWPIFSGTKSFWGVAALAASREGLFSLDDRVSDTITEWKQDRQKSQITIRQLLNFTDGLEGASRLHRESVRDRNAAALRLQLVAQPGTAFTYGPSHLQVFCELFRRKLVPRSPFSYLKRKVLDPLRLGALEHKEDSRGNPLLATGFKLTAREWARFGDLVLDGGKGVVPRDVLQQAFSGSTVNPAYGLTFWLNGKARDPAAREADIEQLLSAPWQRVNWHNVCICRDAPADMVVGLGSGYQRLFIIPSANAVIVRQGSNARFSDAAFLPLVLGVQRSAGH